MITKEQYTEAVSIITRYEQQLFEEYSKTVEYREKHLSKLLKTDIEDLGLSARAFNRLKAAKINNLEELVQFDTNELLRIRNFGKVSLVEIEAILIEKGLRFGMNLKGMVNDTP